MWERFGSSWHDARAHGMMSNFHYLRAARLRMCADRPLLRLRDARLTDGDEDGGVRYLRLRAHPTRALRTAHFLARASAVCSGAASHTRPNVCREGLCVRVCVPRSTFSCTSSFYRHLHLSEQQERARSAPQPTPCAHAIDARALTDHVFSRVCAYRLQPSAGITLAVPGASRQTLAL